MYNYMRLDTPDDWEIKKLQDKILEIAVYVDEFCTKNDIQYCLMGGSALGAVRHEGFIPWDDDLDFFMTPDNYEKFVAAFQKNGDHDKYLLEPLGEMDNMVTIGKVRAKGTTYIETDLTKYDIHHCIYLDIFILHNCPNNKLLRMHQYIWAKYIVAKGQSTRDIYRYGLVLRTALRILRLFPRRFLMKFALRQVYAFRNCKSDFYCNYLGKAKLKKGTYEKRIFGTYKKVPFEKTMLYVPEHVENFLSERFGDYMKIPDLGQIRREQHASVWDTEKDYTEYLTEKPTISKKYLF